MDYASISKIDKSININPSPQLLKRAKVTPISKKGSTEHLPNYRSIAFCKINSQNLEKLLKKQILENFVGNSFFCKSQFGCRQ